MKYIGGSKQSAGQEKSTNKLQGCEICDFIKSRIRRKVLKTSALEMNGQN